MDVVARIVTWLNLLTNALGRFLLAPIGMLPGWLSATIVSVVTGGLLLLVYKYTSNQRAIRRVRDDISAHLLALKLFKDSTSVILQAQGRVFRGAFFLVLFSVVPTLVMLVPVSLLLIQLALWYQSQPLKRGEETLVTAKLSGEGEPTGHEVSIEAPSAVEVVMGPVHVLSRREVWWKIKACENGYHRILLHVDGRTFEKELAIGDTFMRLSAARPGWYWKDILLHPSEPPLEPGAPLELIEVDYPDRLSWTSGTDSWVIYWLVVSMVAALCFRPVLNVNI